MNFIFLLTICTLTLSIAFLALKSNFQSLTNKFFFLFILFFDSWLFSNYLSNHLSSYREVLLFNKLIFLSTTFLGLFLALFISVYPNARINFNRKVLYLAILFSIVVGILSLTNLIVKNVIIKNGISEVVFGKAIILYVVLLLTFLIYSILVLLIKFWNSKGIERVKLQYLMIGISLTTVGVISTNLVLPLVFKNFDLSNFGPGFSVILVGLSGYSIIKHRLLGVKVLIGSLLSIILISFFTSSVFYLVLIIENEYLSSPLSLSAGILNIFVSIIFSITFIWIYRYINYLIRRTYLHTNYDPVIELDKFNASISTKLKLTEVSDEIQHKLKDTLKVENVVLFLKKDPIGFEVVSANNIDVQIDIATIKEFFTNFSYQTVVKDEIESQVLTDLASEIVIQVYRWMTENEFTALVSLADDESFQGFIAVGRRSIPYDNIDISFLESISRSSNIALGRSNYFREYEQLIQELEAKVAERTQKLADALRVEKDMLDIVGHELRTPLTIARNAISMMQLRENAGKADINGIDDLIEKAEEGIVRESKILDTILSSTRIENTRLILKEEKVDANDVVNDTVDGNGKDAESKGLKLFTTVPKDILFGWADRSATQQILDNLVSNAIKYTFQGSIEVKVEEAGDFIKFSVIDTGEGISPENLKLLGRKFFRINSHSDTDAAGNKVIRPGGTGIGLYVVFNMSKMMGGDIKVESEVGKGSTFSFTIPKYVGQVPKSPSEQQASSKAMGSFTAADFKNKMSALTNPGNGQGDLGSPRSDVAPIKDESQMTNSNVTKSEGPMTGNQVTNDERQMTQITTKQPTADNLSDGKTGGEVKPKLNTTL